MTFREVTLKTHKLMNRIEARAYRKEHRVNKSPLVVETERFSISGKNPFPKEISLPCGCLYCRVSKTFVKVESCLEHAKARNF